MVRVKDKKAKGDDAFTTRKQKVGRKKLAPATTTRAEVHARTLRLSTSATMAAAMQDTGTTAGSRQGKKVTAPSVQSFAELLSGMNHYKAAQRASSFAMLTRLLHLQREKDEAAAASTNNKFDGFLTIPSHVKAATAIVATPTGMTGLSPLEKLKGFSAALEAMADTDDDVRRAALQALEIIIDPQWISMESRSTSTAALENLQDGLDLSVCEQSLFQSSSQNTDGLGCIEKLSHVQTNLHSSSVLQTSLVAADRAQAVLQAVHISLTHALKSVRLAGVELLAILLRSGRGPLIRTASRAVCRQQRHFYRNPSAPASLSVQSFSASGDALQGPAAEGTGNAASDEMKEREEEEEWMLTLVRRVSQLVLRTKYMSVLPSLLEVFLGGGGDGCAALTAAGAYSQSGADWLIRSMGDGAYTSNGVVWYHPALVSTFFDNVLPQWANLWKELMEMQLGLLRQEDRLVMATALARAFATVLMFMKKRQHEQLLCTGDHGAGASGAKGFLPRVKLQYMKDLFIHKVPVSMRELLSPPPTRMAAAHSSSPALVHGKGMKARLELCLSIVTVCVPLAGTDEGWKSIKEYFHIVFPEKSATTTAGPSFDFPSIRQLEQSVRAYLQVLQLYPCVSHAFSQGDDAWINRGSGPAAVAAGVTAATASPRSGTQPPNAALLTIRLLHSFPALMTAVVKRVAQPMRHASKKDAEAETAALVRVLCCALEVVRRFAIFPIDELSVISNSAAEDTTVLTCRRELEEGMLLVPRLLFALREQPLQTASQHCGIKRDREEGDTTSINTPTGAAAEEAKKEVRLTAILHDYPSIVNMVVYRFLHVLWLLCSTGHPILGTTDAQTASTRAATSSTGPVFSIVLRKSVQLLFGAGRVGGVLQRCSGPTVLLAHSILRYLEEMEGKCVNAAGLETETAGTTTTISTDTVMAKSAAASRAVADVLSFLQ